MITWLVHVPWTVPIVVCLTLGLAPFWPEPHIWEKLKMLFDGTLTRPIDIFDFFFHGIAWLFLFAKIAVTLARVGR